MLSKTIEAALNKQISLEGYASYLYLSMASWCERESLSGCAEFMHRQSEEEREHMLKIFNYINEIGEHALTPSIPQPPHEWTSIQELFHEVFAHEQKVTASIDAIVKLASSENDHRTFNFLQWFIEEQMEEEALMQTILDRIKLIGDGPQSLYYIDKEVAQINTQAIAAEGNE
jgi:ferritin